MKTILVPTDFSKPALWALEVATGIAERAKATLVLLHVIEQPTEDSFNIEGEAAHADDWEGKLFTMKMIEKSKNELAEAVASIGDRDIDIKTELRIGNPFHGIRSIITDHKVDLVVMGTAGHTKYEEMLIGSNTEKVVRYSRCPVLTIHEPTSETNFKNIVYATSLNDRERAFAKIVTQAQDMYDSTIHLVRINTPSVFQPDHTVRKTMEVFARKANLRNYTINIFSDFSEEDGIIEFAASVKADMIAMATHGRTGFARVLAGSIAEDVVNHSQTPVLTYLTKDSY